jgi:hypothetical protein
MKYFKNKSETMFFAKSKKRLYVYFNFELKAINPSDFAEQHAVSAKREEFTIKIDAIVNPDMETTFVKTCYLMDCMEESLEDILESPFNPIPAVTETEYFTGTEIFLN